MVDISNPKSTIKFLCSYGGKILPRYPDAKLRYLGGQTRVLAVDRSIPFSELLVKLGELCGSAVSLRCQLPSEDLDALVTITSDEDLANLIEEYDRLASPIKIRAFLSPPKPFKKASTSPLSKSSSSSSSASSSSSGGTTCAGVCSGFGSSPRYSVMQPVVDRCVHQIAPPMAYPKSARKNIPLPHYAYHQHGRSGHVCLIHNGNHWQ
ncbi:hypothetical protein L6164_020542 [Bauhinia variegata]|uniref:Uncharacterized protein n=1 Tax=Bauhinia variegata TaxID=167791 RepID=A0ACB9MVS6_BAUVA|nr:hypothetical protein L6164_020542 [Bauhinia variegata]